MPIFEFACTSCGYRFEKLERPGTAVHPVCPACGSQEVKKQLSAFAASTSSGCATTSNGGG